MVPIGIIPLLSRLLVMLVDGSDISRDARLSPGFVEFVKQARDVARKNPISTFGFSREDMGYLYTVLNSLGSRSLDLGSV